tara:strand:- start:164 stop:475 length:312 start_codon:yes stop_codon:yes gene_type:complete
MSGYNGADEDEIMDKVFNELAVAELDSYNNKTQQKVLTKKNSRRASEILLEACHKLKQEEVPAYVEKNFEEAWKSYDQNNEGFIRFEETHTFMRSFFGRLNKF